MTSNPTDIHLARLFQLFLDKSEEGYAILNSQDEFIYINRTYAQWSFCCEPEAILGHSFSDCIINAWKNQQGVRIETKDIHQWLDNAATKRWKKEFRSFEVDLLDGRWLLVTEQIIGEQFLFLHATEVSRMKALERDLLVAQKNLNEQLLLDILTGLPNRRAFNHKIGNEIARARRENSPLILILFDLDKFKSINDTYGHQAGDKVLSSLGRVLKLHLRQYDYVARIGGEEFALVMTNTHRDTAHIVVERLRIALASSPFYFEDHLLPVTASFGGAEFGAEDELENLFSRADDNLYLAKDKGRNCVVF